MGLACEEVLQRISFDPFLNKIEGVVVLAGIVDALHQLIRQSRQFVSQVLVAKNQFAAFSILENLEPDRLVLADTCKTMRYCALNPNDRLGEDPRRRAGTPVRFQRFVIQTKNFVRDLFDFELRILIDLLLISRVIEIFVVVFLVE